MIHMVLKFSEFCRASDLNVSTSEVLDCLTHMELVNVIDEKEFRTALCANFVKTARDKSHFNKLYDIFFHDLRVDENILTDDELNNSEERAEMIDFLRQNVEGGDADSSIIDFLEGDPLGFLEDLRRLHASEENASKVVKSNLGGLSGRLEIMLQLNRAQNRIMEFMNERSSERGEQNPDGGTENYFTRRINAARRMLSEEKKPENRGLKHVKTDTVTGTGLGNKFFSSLTITEIEEMRVAIEQLVRKLKDIVTRRWAVQSSGILDIKKTLRRASRYNGVPLDLTYKKKPPRKGKIVTLCDISGSVWSAARFMLNMLYSLHECFSKVRTFVFVSRLAEATEIFDGNDINDAIDKVMTGIDLDYNALTDYGETFHEFQKSYLHILDRKTTLIIVGDGRSNYFNPGESALEEMREKCRRVIWLNPEPEKFWSYGDSEMGTYMAYCHEVRPCQNLNQLVNFIQELVL
jgi:uncharacterized protein